MDKAEKRKSHYNKQGMYNGYDKNHKERDALDYYATDPKEVTNILETLNLPLSNANILEPCCGGGHMVKGIMDYNFSHFNSKNWKLFASDVQKRESILNNDDWYYGSEYDFLSDTYPFIKDIDYIIMNPPYSSIEPFVMKALSIADYGVLVLGRLQFLEGVKRYENIFKNYPPTDIYVYIDRIACYKNGDFNIKGNSSQAYAWFYFNLREQKDPQIHWIHRK